MKHSKMWAAFSAAVLVTVHVAFGGITQQEAEILATAWLGVGAVWFVPNSER